MVVKDVRDTGERQKSKYYSSPLYGARIILTLDSGREISVWATSLKKRDLPSEIESYRGAIVDDRKESTEGVYISRYLL